MKTESSPHAAMRVRIAPSVYARAFGEELVLLDFGKGEYFGLDAVGVVVWRALERGETVGEAASAVCREFDVSESVAREDVLALVSHMLDASLLAPL